MNPEPTITYKVFNLQEAKEGGFLPLFQDWGDDNYFHWGVWRCEDDVPVEFIGGDGGEPEDQTLLRDWRWVTSALQAAYELGRGTA